MKKTSNFFVISNFNTDPEKYLKYCDDYHIYDQSTDPIIKDELQKKYKKISFVENTGHNISDYFRFFVDHYEKLPAFMMLGKGNMIGRHISEGYFSHVYDNKFYTALYDDRSWVDKPGVAYHVYDGAFLEINNNWYAGSKKCKYFRSYNDLLGFIFMRPILPKWLLFSPGACYIVSKEQVLKYPKEFYENLRMLISFTYFPVEAYHVERMLTTIFCANYELQGHMLTVDSFQSRLAERELIYGDSIDYENLSMSRRLLNSAKRRYKKFLLNLIF